MCALAWLKVAEARTLLGAEPEPDGDLLAHPALRELLAAALAGHNDAAGSAARVERLLVMAQPASLDAGEITDKGYVNQCKVLRNTPARETGRTCRTPTLISTSFMPSGRSQR